MIMDDIRRLWTIEDTSNLIEVYRSQTNLWNPNDPNYKNKISKFDSLKIMANDFKTTVHEIERKLKNINSQYQRERRNYKEMKKLGTGNEFKAKWFGYAAMSFLHEKNKAIGDNTLEFEGTDSSSSNITKQTALTIKETVKEELNKPPNVNFEPNTTTTATIKKDHKLIRKPLYSIPKYDGRKPKLLNINNKLSGRTTLIKSVSRRNYQLERDEFDVYGELVAHKVRALKTDFTKATVQHLINNILYEAQIGKYDPENGPPSPTCSIVDE